ncbi:hypothetical protein GLAREA_03296 [Glarea lozoyensis ATCC 20868]|uniref:Uncharacterized protein n=1 Tax=Glarea lozoyensis (strain ATCC 20868 / MF5171) TaxID=1116229 RepID=S3D5M1_GLAL2|nr:uncharacterized protein GLAREA_03296 [Glarea lozoyensis ATCC 20868]EPE27381.1 hypothetical protein GLAREA_03296 [Glarea lozoyensis ATCC 20868]
MAEMRIVLGRKKRGRILTNELFGDVVELPWQGREKNGSIGIILGRLEAENGAVSETRSGLSPVSDRPYHPTLSKVNGSRSASYNEMQELKARKIATCISSYI